MEAVRDRAAIIGAALRTSRPSGDGWLRTNCPFCPSRLGTPDRRVAFGYQTSTGGYHCFRCGARGHIDGPLVNLPQVEPADRVELEMPSSFLPLSEEPAASALVAEDARCYLLGRGIGPELWRVARIGVAVSGHHFGRVIVPMFDDLGERWIGWVGRAWVDGAPMPYLYPRGMERASLLYNHDALLRVTDEPAMICEGVFDTFPVWPDGVAVLGKPSNRQVDALLSARRPLVIVMDADAWRDGWALVMILRMRGCRAGAVRLPRELVAVADPDEVPINSLRVAMRQCLDKDKEVSL